jgi:hypothetical protein
MFQEHLLRHSDKTPHSCAKTPKYSPLEVLDLPQRLHCRPVNHFAIHGNLTAMAWTVQEPVNLLKTQRTPQMSTDLVSTMWCSSIILTKLLRSPRFLYSPAKALAILGSSFAAAALLLVRELIRHPRQTACHGMPWHGQPQSRSPCLKPKLHP